MNHFLSNRLAAKTFIALFVIALISLNDLKAQTFGTAIEYLDYISAEYKKISSETWDYTCAIAHGGRARKIENTRKDLLKTIASAQKKITKMSDFQGNTSYRDSVLSYLNISYLVLNDDFGKVVNMEEIAEQSYDNMEAYMTAQQVANEKLDAANEIVNTELKVFAGQHNITITESQDELERKLNKAGDVFKYYNEIYLIFFKSYKQEMYMLDALNKSDVNALEQNRSTLSQFAADGLARLENIKSYKGDVSLITACKQMLSFYKEEAGEKSQQLSDFIMKSDDFNKRVSLFQKNSSPSQQEVDDYNKMVNTYNDAVNQFNKTNNDLNNERNKILNNWNNSSKSFLDKQIPSKK